MKSWKKILAAMLGGFWLSSQALPAGASVEMEKVPLLTYVDAAVPVYSSPGGSKKGTIPAGRSLVLVKQIRSDGWAYGSYKPLNKRKRVSCWFRMTDVQGYPDFRNYTDQLVSDQRASRTRSTGAEGASIGFVSSNEDVTVVAERGEKAKIIFLGDGNKYRMGWVFKSALESNRGADVESSFEASDIYLESGTQGAQEWNASGMDGLGTEDMDSLGTQNLDGTEDSLYTEEEGSSGWEAVDDAGSGETEGNGEENGMEDSPGNP